MPTWTLVGVKGHSKGSWINSYTKYIIPYLMSILYIIPYLMSILYIIPYLMSILYIIPYLMSILYIIPYLMSILYIIPYLMYILIFKTSTDTWSKTFLFLSLHKAMIHCKINDKRKQNSRHLTVSFIFSQISALKY